MEAADIQTLAGEIAEKLGETEEQPLKQLELIIEHLGAEFAQEVLNDTLELEKNGGMLTHDEQRRRTPGGVYFYLAKGKMKYKMRYKIFPNYGQRQREKDFKWEDRLEFYEDLQAEAGSLRNFMVTLIGRPEKVEVREQTVVMTLAQTDLRSPSLPKGVPTIPADPMSYYTIYMGLKHWEKVQPLLEENPKDFLVAEGTCVLDGETQSIAMFVNAATTRETQREERRNEEAASGQKVSPKSKANGKTATQPQVKLPDSAPTDMKNKLKQLQNAADTLRQKIEAMETEGKKSGIEMTRRLLANTEKQIEALVSQHTE